MTKHNAQLQLFVSFSSSLVLGNEISYLVLFQTPPDGDVKRALFKYLFESVVVSMFGMKSGIINTDSWLLTLV